MPIQIRRILLIHADDVIKEMLLLCLETILNCEVITVDLEAEVAEKTLEADAILLDVDETIPDLGWREICQNLKRNS